MSTASPSFIPAMVAAQHRRIVRKFLDANAIDAPRARTFEDLEVRHRHLAGRMLESGVLVAAGRERYYLSADGLARWEKRRRLYLLTALGAVALGALIAWGIVGR